MKRIRIASPGVLAAGVLALGGVAAAQMPLPVPTAPQGPQVNVNVANVRTDIAKSINVDVTQVPATVQAPVDEAAIVCGVAANVLTMQSSQPGGASCTATKTDGTLNQLAQSQLGAHK